MSARRLLNVVHTMLLEAHGEEEVWSMLHPVQEDRASAVLALGGEVAHD